MTLRLGLVNHLGSKQLGDDVGPANTRECVHQSSSTFSSLESSSTRFPSGSATNAVLSAGSDVAPAFMRMQNSARG